LFYVISLTLVLIIIFTNISFSNEFEFNASIVWTSETRLSIFDFRSSYKLTRPNRANDFNLPSRYYLQHAASETIVIIYITYKVYTSFWTTYTHDIKRYKMKQGYPLKLRTGSRT